MHWTKKILGKLSKKYSFKVLSFGEEIFLERMKDLSFYSWAGLTKVVKVLTVFKKMRINLFLAKIVCSFYGWSPIILTLKKIK